MGTSDLVKVFNTILRPGAEYCSVVYDSLIPKYVSDRLESVQKQAYKIIYGWNVDYNQMVEDGQVETLAARRLENCLRFANRNKDTERFKKWFPLAPNPRVVRQSTRRTYQETKANTERDKNNPLQSMIRLLNNQ